VTSVSSLKILEDNQLAPHPSQTRDITKDPLFKVKIGTKHEFSIFANATGEDQAAQMCETIGIVKTMYSSQSLILTPTPGMDEAECDHLTKGVVAQLQYEMDVHKDTRDSLTVEAPNPQTEKTSNT